LDETAGAAGATGADGAVVSLEIMIGIVADLYVLLGGRKEDDLYIGLLLLSSSVSPSCYS